MPVVPLLRAEPGVLTMPFWLKAEAGVFNENVIVRKRVTIILNFVIFDLVVN
jgi:hypothetical protein